MRNDRGGRAQIFTVLRVPSEEFQAPKMTIPQKTPLTAQDLILLDLLQRDATLTIDALAERAAMSASAAQRRLKRLREDKVILAEVAILDQKAVGQPLTLHVELELERDRPELLPALQQWIGRTPHVQEAWYVTGRGDLMLVVTAASIEAFDAFMERMLADNRNIRKFTTSVVLKTLKRGLAVALEPCSP
jgi:Lrp/AsnC family transcriptional regulator, leucine-responsive regulatory protein